MWILLIIGAMTCVITIAWGVRAFLAYCKHRKLRKEVFEWEQEREKQNCFFERNKEAIYEETLKRIRKQEGMEQ